jgi:hypothetical protein
LGFFFHNHGLEYNVPGMAPLRTKTLAPLREPALLIFKLVGIPLICLTPLFFAALYFFGGVDLLRFTVHQLTWKVWFRILGGILFLGFVTWIRHVAWYRGEPQPLWWRRSVWVNLLEIIILVTLIFLGIWAIPRFG